MCMNFGNGGYNAHSTSEYCVIEDMDQACGMGIDLIDSIGCTEHKLKHTDTWTSRTEKSFKRNEDGTYERTKVDDTEQLRNLGDNSRKSYYGYSGGSSYSSTTKTTTTPKKEEILKFETVKYIVNRYDSHILAIKDEILEGVKALCEKSNADFEEFEKVISEKFSNDIKF